MPDRQTLHCCYSKLMLCHKDRLQVVLIQKSQILLILSSCMIYCCVIVSNASKMCSSSHREGFDHVTIISITPVFPWQCTLYYSAMSHCGWSKSQMAASLGNVVPDLWMWRASLLPLALHVVREGVGSEVAAKLLGWQKEGGCDWCGEAEGSSPTLSIMSSGWRCDAVKCIPTMHPRM